jgi:sulfite reductase alpha subunit-like flavoprotein
VVVSVFESLAQIHSNPVPMTLPCCSVLLVLPRLQPRFYSISSSNRASPDKVSITVGVLTATTSAGKTIEGVCSHYLSRLEPKVSRAKVAITKSTFRLPTNTKSPLLMVGAGTGLAPMMGFLQDRQLDQAAKAELGPIHLFFGCRTEHDLIYRALIGSYEKDKLLNFHLALSRPTDQDTKKAYVQDRLFEMGKDLFELLQNPDTHFYVCGDARMADSCFESCVNVLKEHGSLSRVWSVQLLKKMRLEGRWQTDVWGIVSHFEEAKKSIEMKRKTAAKIWLKQLKGGNSDD